MPEYMFWVPGLPVQQGSKVYGVTKAGRAYGRESAGKRLYDWRSAIVKVVSDSVVQPPKLDGPVAVELTFVFPPLKSSPKRFWKTTAPDLDKLVRAVLDSLTKSEIYTDDARVVSLAATKSHDTDPGVAITVRTMKEEN